MRTGKWEKENKKTSFITITIYAVLWFILYIVANIDAFTNILNGILKILSPLIIGTTVAFLFNPVMRAFDDRVFRRVPWKRLRRILSILVTYLIAALVIALFAFLIIPELSSSINELFSNFDNYVTNVVNSANKILNNLLSKGNATYREYINPDDITEKLSSILSGTGTLLETLYDYAQQYGGKLVTSLSNIVIGLFISVYLLASKEQRFAQCRKIGHAFLSDERYGGLSSTLKMTGRLFGNFIEGKVVDSLIIGVLTYIVLTIFRMPYTALISVVVGFTNVIPYFGPIIGAVPSAFIILIAEPAKAIPFLIIILVIQQLDGNVIGPRILGDNTGLSSLGIILSIAIMSGLFGIVGMLIGVPVCAVLVILFTQFINAKLTQKGKSSNISDYYPPKADQTEQLPAGTETQANDCTETAAAPAGNVRND